MNYESELRLITASFEKRRLRTEIVTSHVSEQESPESELSCLLSGNLPSSIDLDAAKPRTLYKFTDSFGLLYRYFLLETDCWLVAGPYINKKFTESELLEIGERNGISPKDERHFSEFCGGIPVLEDTDTLFTVLDTFLEHLWESDSFAIVDCSESASHATSPINAPLGEDSFAELLVSMKAMEQRYGYENELIEAVTLGQLHKEAQLLSSFTTATLEKRTSDTMRNSKNYGIIMNTLLRKAAENGGVHPVYLNRVSSDFAVKIEQANTLDEIHALMLDMFRSYCRLVRKHSLRSYSPLVQKTILIIDSDLAADLSLSTLAEVQGVSAGYLATVFKREAGRTITAYVRERRMSHAEHLLESTNLQIQTIALHCGILDLQYFSKLFKRETGKSPKEYRESAKKMAAYHARKNLQ